MNSRLSRGAVVSVGLLAALPDASSGAVPPGLAGVQPLQQCVAAEAREADFSGVVSVIRRGQPIFYARGTIAGAGSLPISSTTAFNLGSAGKMFTAVAIAQMIDAGKAGLDDAIGRFVTGLTPQASAVTIRQLLDHSSGLGNYFAPENLAWLAKARTLEDLLPLVAKDRPAFPPGSRFAYSDTGYLLLGLLIEHVSGRSYGDYIRGHIFSPAHMAATGLEPPAVPPRAAGMTAMPAPQEVSRLQKMTLSHASLGLGDKGLLFASPDANHVPGHLRPAPEAALNGSAAGGGFSTAADMQKFFAALMKHELTSAAGLNMLVSPQIEAAPAEVGAPKQQYGFGFGVGRYRGHRWFGHDGGAPGVNAEAFVFPDDQVSIVILSNRDPPGATVLFRLVRDFLFRSVAGDFCGSPMKSP